MKTKNFSENNNYISYSEAIYEALFQIMKTDKSVFVYGQGVDDPKGHYGTTKNLHKVLELIGVLIHQFVRTE